MKKRKNHAPDVKAKVALEAARERLTLVTRYKVCAGAIDQSHSTPNTGVV